MPTVFHTNNMKILLTTRFNNNVTQYSSVYCRVEYDNKDSKRCKNISGFSDIPQTIDLCSDSQALMQAYTRSYTRAHFNSSMVHVSSNSAGVR